MSHFPVTLSDGNVFSFSRGLKIFQTAELKEFSPTNAAFEPDTEHLLPPALDWT